MIVSESIALLRDSPRSASSHTIEAADRLWTGGGAFATILSPGR